MIQLVEGECHCISSARILLRRCGYMPGRDYEEINRRLVKENNLFKEHPELYNTVCILSCITLFVWCYMTLTQAYSSTCTTRSTQWK